MGRRRFQRPNVFKTRGKRPEFYFRARIDVLDRESGAPAKKRPPRVFYLGFVDEVGITEARKRRDEILAEVVNKPQTLLPSQVKFADVLDIYKKDHLSQLRVTTRTDQENAIKMHIGKLGHLRMCDIDALAVQRWISSMGLAESTRRHHFRLLKVIWNRAEEWGFVQRSFPKALYKFGGAKEVKGTDMPPVDQIRRLLAALEDPYRAMAEIALYCGLRISEIRGLKWEDVGPQTLTVRRRVSGCGNVDRLKSGNGKPRVFDVRPVAAVLARLPKEGEWIFGRGTAYRTCNEAIRRARKAAGITVALFGWHHLRAACNTLLRDRGADTADRQALLGHTTEKMNAVYLHAAESDLTRRGDLMLQVQAAIMGETKGVQ